jgi:hypothetical protein
MDATLKGSPKQIKWALEIRAAKLAEIDAALARLDAEVEDAGVEDDHDRRDRETLRIVRHLIENEKSASTLIYERDCPPLSLYFELLGKPGVVAALKAKIGI